MSSLNTSNTADVALASSLGNANGTAVGIAGIFCAYCWGTFSSNTAKVQVSPDAGTTWIDYPGASFTAAGTFAPIYLGLGQLVRATNSGGTINLTLAPMV